MGRVVAGDIDIKELQENPRYIKLMSLVMDLKIEAFRLNLPRDLIVNGVAWSYDYARDASFMGK